MSEQQTAIDEHIKWLEKQIEIEKRLDYNPIDAWVKGLMSGVVKGLNEALEHARAARERQQG